jgi:hypothetical protein
MPAETQTEPKLLKSVQEIVQQSIEYARYAKRTGNQAEYEEEVCFLSTPSRLIDGWVKTREEVEAIIAQEV